MHCWSIPTHCYKIDVHVFIRIYAHTLLKNVYSVCTITIPNLLFPVAVDRSIPAQRLNIHNTEVSVNSYCSSILHTHCYTIYALTLLNIVGLIRLLYSQPQVFMMMSSNGWWRHQMETFPRYWPFMWGIHRSTVNSPHKGQWRGALMFSLICAWINGWVNNREAGDLRRHIGTRPSATIAQGISITVYINPWFSWPNDTWLILHNTHVTAIERNDVWERFWLFGVRHYTEVRSYGQLYLSLRILHYQHLHSTMSILLTYFTQTLLKFYALALSKYLHRQTTTKICQSKLLSNLKTSQSLCKINMRWLREQTLPCP